MLCAQKVLCALARIPARAQGRGRGLILQGQLIRRKEVNTNISNKLLTAQEVAKLLSINESTVYKWTDQGRLPYIDLSIGSGKRCLRFRRSDLEKLIEEKLVQSR